MLSQLPTTKPLKIALYRTSSIGDVVLGTACISLLSLIDRPVQICWIGRAPSLLLLKSAFPSIEIVSFDKREGGGRLLEIAAVIRDCDFFVDLQRNLRSRMLAVILSRTHGVPIFHAKKMQVFRTRLIAEARLRGRKKQAPPAIRLASFRQTSLMLKPLIDGLWSVLPSDVMRRVVESESFPRLPITESDTLKPWQKELRVGKWLAIGAGAAHPTKRAPLGKWCEILFDLKQVKGLGLVFLGDDRDREFSLAITNELGWQGPTLNLSGRLSLWETAQALYKCHFLLSNDSSLAHIAEGVGTSVAMLFGPTVEAFGFVPWRSDSRTFSALTGCRPCSKHGKIECRYGDQKCFHDIDSREVSAYLRSVLQRPTADELSKP